MSWNIQIINEIPLICNNNNHFLFTPIRTNNQNIIIDKKWWNKQGTPLKKLLKDEFENIDFEDITLPHNSTDFKENEIYWKFYTIYRLQFCFENFIHILDNTFIINIPNQDLSILKNLSNLLILTNRKIKKTDIEDISDELKFNIQNILQKFQNNGLFVKLSNKSAKNHKKLYPSKTLEDIFDNLLSSPEVLKSLERDPNMNIILREWNHNINKNNEFRVFIIDKKVRFISQQFWSNPIKLEQTPHEIINKISEFWNNINDKLYFNDCVLDVFLTDKCHLIEINNGCEWSCSGSALFDWISEICILQNGNENYFRVYK
jgi:hypothetical protein